MRFVFVMDPAPSMLPDKDTSFALMRAAGLRGHRCLHAEPLDLWLDGSTPCVRARAVTVADQAPHVSLAAAEDLAIADLDAVLIRKDPPFDTTYLHLTQLLDLAKPHTLVVNDPAALRDANEKIFAFRFSHLMPRSMVGADAERFGRFVAEVGGQAVLKPLDGAGGSGVVRVAADDPNARALVDLLTADGRKMALAQQFLPGVYRGDKRVLLLDGALLGVIRRMPPVNDFRANIHVGGRVEAAELSATEADLVAEVGADLARRGLSFVGLDLIEERLIEINVTSPTGIQELARLTSSNPAELVIQWLERRIG